MFETSAPAEAAPAPVALNGVRVLLATYRGHPHVGGQGVYVRELARALMAAGARVEVASGPPYPTLDPDITLHRLPSLDLFSAANAFTALRPVHLRSWADLSEWLAHNSGAFGELYAFGRRLRRFLARRTGRYDVVHDNQTLADGLWTIHRHIVPVVGTLHHPITIDRDLALASAERGVDRVLIRRWHRFLGMQARNARRLPYQLAVSQAARRAYADAFGLSAQSIAWAWNGVDAEVFAPHAAPTREAGLIVSAASADTPIKGLAVLIHAFAQVSATHPDARLVVIGRLREGPAQRALEAAGLCDRVRFVHGLSQAEIAKLYAEAAIVVCPSLFEGFGFPAAEAMASGAAVIASDGGALPEVVGEAGVITRAGDVEGLACAIGDLLHDPDRRSALGSAARARARAQFSWSAHAQAAGRLYARALKRSC
ncbi:MAG: glycosyltransferase family 4 protein [Maricaulaceae bacterium]